VEPVPRPNGGNAGNGATAGACWRADFLSRRTNDWRVARIRRRGRGRRSHAYERWKREVVTADGAGGYLRVKRPNSPGGEANSTVSEGIAYGMIIAVRDG
jgi:hypothetical protein